MTSPNWGGFFPHGMYGGLAFWVNLFFLYVPFHEKILDKVSNEESYFHVFRQILYLDGLLLVALITICILLSGYIIEEITFFCMKVFATPVKWHYNYTVEILEKNRLKAPPYTGDPIADSKKIKTPEDAEIRFDTNIDEAWINKGTIALINTEVAFGIFFSWLIIVCSFSPYCCFVALLFFLILPSFSYVLQNTIDTWNSLTKENALPNYPYNDTWPNSLNLLLRCERYER